MARFLFGLCLGAFVFSAESSRLVQVDTFENLEEALSDGHMAGHVSHANVSFKQLVRVASEKLNERKAHAYKWIKAASSPVSTVCSWWWAQDLDFYLKAGSFCGIQGMGMPAIQAHIERVWYLMRVAHSELSHGGDSPDILKVFMMPEWALGRRYPHDGTDVVPPLDFDEMQFIIKSLLDKMKASGIDWSDWLMVPGSIYWGLKINNMQLSDGKIFNYAVFNTAPVFYGTDLVWVHNKFHQADNLHATEYWGYYLAQSFPAEPGCAHYTLSSGKICGTDGFKNFVVQANGAAAGKALEEWGLMQPMVTLLVNGLAVALDICADHRAKKSISEMEKLEWLDQFDIQLLISSGMSFSLPEGDGQLALMLRKGGVAISSDGSMGLSMATRFFVAKHDANDGKSTILGNDKKLVLKLAKHFDEMQPKIMGQWDEGCNHEHDEYNTQYCHLCFDIPKFHAEFGGNGGGVQSFCGTMVGNYHLLKVWADPIPLPAPDAEHTRKSDGVASPFDAFERRTIPPFSGGPLVGGR